MNRLLFVLALLLNITLQAQPPKKFYTSIGGNGYDYAYDVKQTTNGGYILAGSTSSFGFGNTDVYLLKLDSMGQIEFQKTYGGYDNESAKAVVQLTDGSYVIAGYTSSKGFGGYDAYIIKTDNLGNLIWEKTFGGTDWDFCNSMVATADGGFILAGSTTSFGYGNTDGYIIKLDATGTEQWHKIVGGTKADEFKSIIQTTDGGYALAGQTKSYNDSLGDAWVFKLNANGDSIWSNTYGGNKEDYFSNLIELPNLNLYFVGANKSHTNTSNSINWQYSINTNNITIYNNFIGNTNTERYNSSAVGINGNVVSVGFNNYLSSYSDANIHLFTENLSYISYSPFGVQQTDELFSVFKTKDKGYVAVGTCNGTTSQFNDILFVKTDSLCNYGVSIVNINDINNQYETINLYPNPGQNELRLKINYRTNFNKIKYQIKSITGENVLQSDIDSEITLININELKPSIYFIQLIDNGIIVATKKTVKTN